MNEADRSELERLKQHQARLELELGTLGKQLERLESRLSQAPRATPPPLPTPPVIKPGESISKPTPTHTPIPAKNKEPVHIELPPVVIPAPAPVMAQTLTQPVAIPPSPTIPAPRPPSVSPQPPVQVSSLPPEPAQVVPLPPRLGPARLSPHMAEAATPTIPTTPPTSEEPTPLPTAPAPARSFELRLGTYWLVRIGIVMLLTGLVFFGNYAYKHYIAILGASGKVTLLYVASGILLGFGSWWQRKAEKDSMRNFAQVLFAGGMAAVYYTTYAIYHVPALQLVTSPLLDGMLLLAWAGFMVWEADRKKSEVLALFAVGLAYYTSIITRVGYFTLYSNLVLTSAAVFFLVRNRWAALSAASLAATYAAYAFWRFFNGVTWEWAVPGQGLSLWEGTWFLMSYWAVFTSAVFLSRDAKFSGERRNAFLLVNNGAFFALFLLTMLQTHLGGFWKFSLIYGSVLIGLAALARKVLAGEPLIRRSYLTQGLVLVTTGIISHPRLAGLQLALVLAMESVVLLVLGQQRKSRILLAGSWIAAGLAIGWGMDGMLRLDPHGLWLAVGLGAVMLLNSFLAHRVSLEQTDVVMRPQPGYFAILAMAVWLVATWNNTEHVNFPVVLAIEALALTVSIYVLRMREITLLAQGYFLLAQVSWSVQAIQENFAPQWWNPVALLLLTLSFCTWWRNQKLIDLRVASDPSWQALELVPRIGKAMLWLATVWFAVNFAGGWTEISHMPADAKAFWLPIALGVLMMIDTLLVHRQSGPDSQFPHRWQPAFSTTMALVIWLAVTWHNTTHANFPLVLMLEGLVLTASIYVLRVPEVSLLAQAYMIFAQAAWLLYDSGTPLPPWWNPILLISMTLGVSHWWQKQKILALPGRASLVCQGIYALAITGILYVWLGGRIEAPSVWLALTSLLAVALTAYGVLTRAWFVALFGQLFLVVSGYQFAVQLLNGRPDPLLALAPMAGLGLLSYATILWFQHRPDATGQISSPLLIVSRVYRWTGLAMSLWWVDKYIPALEQIWVVGLLGFLIFLWAGWRRNREGLIFGAAYTVYAVSLFWSPFRSEPPAYWANLLVIMALLGQQQIAKRLPERYGLDSRAQGAIIVVGGLSVWLFVSRWVTVHASGFYLTASWSALALGLFTCGIVLRERLYRWLGLGIVACALGRIFIFDVWKLELPYRILSFMALGIVLIVLGFVYNKYQEKLKEWL